MNNAPNNNSLLGLYAQTIIRYKYLVVLLTVGLCLLLAQGQSKISFSSDYHYYFGETTPVIKAMEEMDETYANADNVYFSVTPKDGGTVFNQKVLSAVEQLTERAWRMPYATRVDSLTNFQHTTANGDDVIVADLVESATSLDTAHLDFVKSVALTEPFLVNRIVSKDGMHTGVNVVLRLPGKSPAETPTAMAAARELIKNIEAEYPVKVRLTGVHALNNAFGEIGLSDIKTFMPIMYISMIAILFLLFRSLLQVAMTVAVVHLSTISTMGLVGWIGIPLTAPSSITPTIILALAIANAVHIIESFVLAVREGKSKKEAVTESLTVNFNAIFLTSATTLFGFLALNFADTPPYHDLGNITSIGVTIAYFLSITLLPALLVILPNWIKKKERKNDSQSHFWHGLTHFVVGKRTSIVVVFALLTIGLGIPIPRLNLDDRWIEYFSKETTFRNDADFVQSNLTGLYTVEFNIKSTGPNGISELEYLTALEKFSEFYRSHEKVYNVNTITDTLKRLNKSLHSDQKEFYRLPDNKMLAAQYLLLYELSLPYGLDLTNQVSMDKSRTKVVVTFKDVTTAELRQAALEGESWLRQNAPAYMRAIGSGATVIFAHQSATNIRGMVSGTTLSLVLICLLTFAAMRSVRYGVLSLVPNILPFIMTFGIWTLLRGSAGMEVSIVVSATAGVIVDNCVHFITKYLRGRNEKGLSTTEAILYAYENVGNALVFTSLTLLAGYSVLMLSAFSLNSSLGIFSVMTTALALLVVMILLPAIISIFDKEFDKKKGGLGERNEVDGRYDGHKREKEFAVS